MKEFVQKHLTAIIGIVLAVVIVVALVASIAVNNASVKQTKKDVTVELTHEFTLNVTDYFETDEDTLKEAKVDTSAVDTTKLGTYEAYVTFGNEKYTIKVTVEDTTAPTLEVESYCVITKTLELTADAFGSYSDADTCETKLDRFVKVSDLKALTDADIAVLVNDMNAKSNPEGYKDRAEVVPEAEGIYTAILSVTDTSGNKAEKEVLIVYDTTAPTFGLSSDAKELILTQADITSNPGMNLDKVICIDNVDGAITITEDSAVMTDKGTSGNVHTWEVSVKALDKAGNEGAFTYTILVNKKEETKKPANTNNNSNTGNGGNSNQGNGNGGSPSGGGSTSSENNSDIVTVNGFTLDFTGRTEEGKNFDIKLAEAGYYTPVYRAETNSYWMLIKCFEEYYTYNEWLRNYIVERGGTPGNGSGSSFGCINQPDAYVIEVEVIQE